MRKVSQERTTVQVHICWDKKSLEAKRPAREAQALIL